MECSVEYCHLRYLRKHMSDGVDACHVNRVVEWSNAVALFNHGNHFVVNENALVELLATMHYAVTNGIDFVEALDAAKFRTGEQVEDSLDCSIVVGDVKLKYFLRTVGELEFNESVGQTDFLNSTFSQNIVSLDFD